MSEEPPASYDAGAGAGSCQSGGRLDDVMSLDQAVALIIAVTGDGQTDHGAEAGGPPAYLVNPMATAQTLNAVGLLRGSTNPTTRVTAMFAETAVMRGRAIAEAVALIDAHPGRLAILDDVRAALCPAATVVAMTVTPEDDGKARIRRELDVTTVTWVRAEPPGVTLDDPIEYAHVLHTDGVTYTLMRQSRRPDVVLYFTPAEWEAFRLGARDGEFNVPGAEPQA
jgi:hypothetical protein